METVFANYIRKPNFATSLTARQMMVRYIATMLMLFVAIPLPAAEQETPAKKLLTAPTKLAVEKALRFLAQAQSDDGSFGRSGYGRNVGVCGLAGLAFMSSGSTPGRGPYGQNINKCIDYVLSNAQENGFINVRNANSHGPMYGHGFATLFVAEVYGMSPREDLREKLAKAVRLIVDTQNDEGGWRYHPQKQDADLSVTVCQIMALRAAKNSGIAVPNETIEKCVDYVKRSQNADGGFMYTLHGGASAFPRSAAGVVALYSAGVYKGGEVDRGLRYLDAFLPSDPKRRNDEGHFFYGHYYGVQAMWHSGGERWNRWYPAIRDKLIARQSDNGAWINSICPEYGTAMAAIVLQLPNNCLPILQR